MRKVLLTLAATPLVAVAAIGDWSYTPYISYNANEPSPGAIIKKGRNFELLQALWEKPQSLAAMKNAGFDFSEIDTVLLRRQGMIYPEGNVFRSAIPFIDSVALSSVRDKASLIAQAIMNETRPEMQAFMATLDDTGFHSWAFPLAHSLVLDGDTWEHIGVSQESATIYPTEDMSWNGVYYFFRPEVPATYGTNGLSLGDEGTLYFSWGNEANPYLCTAFIKTNIRKGLVKYLHGEELAPEMLKDCRDYGVTDEKGGLKIPVIDGKNAISKSADAWAQAVAKSFLKHFDAGEMASIIGLKPENEAALKVILYHEILFELDKILDDTQLLPIPEILNAKAPEDKKETATVAYIKLESD